MFAKAKNAANFIDLGQPDDVSNYVANVMVEKSLAWQTSQEALRGRVLDTNSLGLAVAIGGASDAFSGGVFTAATNLSEDITAIDEGG